MLITFSRRHPNSRDELNTGQFDRSPPPRFTGPPQHAKIQNIERDYELSDCSTGTISLLSIAKLPESCYTRIESLMNGAKTGIVTTSPNRHTRKQTSRQPNCRSARPLSSHLDCCRSRLCSNDNHNNALREQMQHLAINAFSP